MRAISTVVLFASAMWTPAHAKVNVGNLEVARLCSDTAFGLMRLGGASKGEIANYAFGPEHAADVLLRQVSEKLALLWHVVADQETREVLTTHMEDRKLIEAMEAVPECLTKTNCTEDGDAYLTQAAWDLLAACRSDYLGD